MSHKMFNSTNTAVMDGGDWFGLVGVSFDRDLNGPKLTTANATSAVKI